MNDPVEIVAKALRERWNNGLSTNDSDPTEDAATALDALHAAGWRIVRPTTDDPHLVVFKAGGWEIEHSAGCRNAGRMRDCWLHRKLSRDCDGPPPEGLGRYRADESAEGWTFTPAPDAPTTTALLITDEWMPAERDQ